MRIFVTSSYGYWGNFNPDDVTTKTERDVQVGGGETAMIQISRELARLGHDVTVFYDVDYFTDYDGVHYLPTNLFVPLVCQQEHDVLISWDNVNAFRFADRARAHVLAFQLNDPVIGVFDWSIDLYMHPSQWHADRTRVSCPEVSPNKQRVNVTNGVDYSRYIAAVEKTPKQVIYSSSPDRGLHHLLRMWPLIVAREPEATLHVYYDMNKWLENDAKLVAMGIHTVTSDRAEEIRKLTRERHPSVFLHGGVGQWRLAEEQSRSCIMAYPCDPVRPTEGFSMTMLEGLAAGCHIVTTNADALGELWRECPNVHMLDLPVDDALWINTIVDLLRAEPAQPLYHKRFSWAVRAQVWEKELFRCLQKPLQ